MAPARCSRCLRGAIARERDTEEQVCLNCGHREGSALEDYWQGMRDPAPPLPQDRRKGRTYRRKRYRESA